MKLAFPDSMPPSDIGMFLGDCFAAGADFAHVEGLPLTNMNREQCRAYISEISGAIGKVTLTDDKEGTEIWELNSATSPNAAFVPYHTDNPFLEEPETLVSFWNIRSSRRGGENLILPVRIILEALDSAPEHQDLLAELTQAQVPFTYGDRTATGPILESAHMQARYDQKYIGPEYAILGRQFTEALGELGCEAQSVKLAEGNALFFNNRTALHARMPYSDPDRLSLRVRIQAFQHERA